MGNNAVTPAAESVRYSATSYRKIMAEQGLVLSYTQGVSMRPLIFAELSYVAIVPVEVPQIGDLLLFEQMRRRGTACILHRLVAIEGDVYVTRGDNCLNSERITRSDIIGKVECVYWNASRRSALDPRLWLPRLCGAQREGQSLVLTVHDRGYQRYSKVWDATWPLRRAGYAVRGVAARVYRKLRKLIR